MIFAGIITALITPFDQNDNIDYRALEILIEKQIEAKVSALIIAGSTGEGSSLSRDEYYTLIKAAAKYSNSRINIIVGLTGVSTKSVCSEVSALCAMNIQGIMCTLPHYIRPEQEGIYQHFKAINDVSTVPIIIYLHPGRTGVDMSDNTVLRLATLAQIVAIKDASNDIEKPLRLLPQTKPDFTYLSGDDSRFLSYMVNGGHGCISVIANIFPKICVRMYNLWVAGEIENARQILQKLIPIICAISAESNPIGIKYAAHSLALCSDQIRLPLTWARANTKKEITSILHELIDLEKNV